MTLFDFSKAYDRVWKTGLLQKMHLLGISARFLVWISSWLTNRQARVRVNAKVGRSRTFKEGLPQGSVLSPLLFVIYINDLLMQFEDTTLVSAYADDLAIACSGRSKIDMTKILQKEVDKVVKWSDDACLTLNTNKCEAEASWQPHITIRGLPLSFNAAPTFLGVQYNRQPTFSDHAKKICQAMTKKTNILRALGGTTWGWRPADLRTIYIATQRFLAKYGSQAWAPWLSKSNLGKLESAQLNAARAITGHLRSTPGELISKEAHLTPLEARYKNLSFLKADSWLQQADTDLRRLTLDRQAPQRLVKKRLAGIDYAGFK